MTEIGFRIFKDYPRADHSLVQRLSQIPVANLDDVMGRIYSTDSGLQSVNHLPLAGAACTVKVPAGDNLVFHHALDLCRPGDIIVVDGAGYPERSLCGEQIYRYAIKKRIGGLIIDGAVRDVDALYHLDFPVYARSVCPNGPYKNGPGEVNVPVCIGGIVVFPGDLIVGDRDGLIVVRPKDAPAVAEAAEQLGQKEQKNFEMLKNSFPDKSWVMEKLIAQKCCFRDGTYPSSSNESGILR